MKNEEIVRALRRLKVETASLVCMGCGCEHDCGIHGCRIVREAAELIEKLADRCARYAEEIAVAQERQRWIPVTERLPEEGVPVLINYIGTDGEVYADGVAVWTEYGCFLWEGSLADCEEDVVVPISHWMPLPEGPEVE